MRQRKREKLVQLEQETQNRLGEVMSKLREHHRRQDLPDDLDRAFSMYRLAIEDLVRFEMAEAGEDGKIAD